MNTTIVPTVPTIKDFGPLTESFLRNPMPLIRKTREVARNAYYEPLRTWVISKHADIGEAASAGASTKT